MYAEFWSGKLLRNLTVARPKRCEANMKMDLREMRCGDVKYMELAVVIVEAFSHSYSC
jgi:hypothetical protein